MKFFALTLSLLVLSTLSLNAQVASFKLQELADNAATAFTHYLGLSKTKEAKVRDAYYTYYDDLTNNGWKTDYVKDLSSAEAKKETRLINILSEREYTIYTYLKESATLGEYEYYDEVISSIAEQEELTKELQVYFSKKIFPVLSALKFTFNEKLSADDETTLERNNEIFEIGLDSMLENKVELSFDNIRTFSKPAREIEKIFVKYDVAYNKALSVILASTPKWDKEIYSIYRKYNYDDEQIEVLKSPQLVLSTYGLNSFIDKIKFAQIDPFNEAKYLADVSKFQYFSELLVEFLEEN